MSVEHSGTRFVKNHLLRGRLATYYHLVPTDRDFIEQTRIKYPNVFVPLRHPLEIARSWSKKNMPLNLLNGRFDYLAEICTANNFSVIPIDVPDRLDYIVEARRRTGLQLDPGDWPKVGEQKDKKDHCLTNKEVEIVRPAIARNVDFFERYYLEVLTSGTFYEQSSAA